MLPAGQQPEKEETEKKKKQNEKNKKKKKKKEKMKEKTKKQQKRKRKAREDGVVRQCASIDKLRARVQKAINDLLCIYIIITL
eukprot:COSAG06_NODE_4207_length_4478_cov_13.617264_2_plen_83_part_00